VFSVNYAGEMDATAGLVGGWNINVDTLSSEDNTTKLTAKDGIYTDTLVLIDDDYPNALSFKSEKYYPIIGQLGKVVGKAGSAENSTTTCVGIDTREETIQKILKYLNYE